VFGLGAFYGRTLPGVRRPLGVGVHAG
jgi:hypothetical protein